MIISLKKSILFTRDPDLRFAKEYNLPVGVWRDLWKRYKLYGYTIKDVCDFYEMKTNRKTNYTAMSRWIWRSEIYSKVHPLMNKGVELVTSEFFGNDEDQVIKEITKNIPFSVNGDTKTLL